MNSQSRFDAIEELVDVLQQTGRITCRKTVLDAVVAREKTRSTGIGMGLAIPHAKCVGVNGLVAAMGRPNQPMDFESIDGKSVDAIVLFVSAPDQNAWHMKFLSRLSRLMQSEAFRTRFASAGCSHEIHRAIEDHEEQ
jgi:mannitol/fructose-specific phosphotransferase system IIA component (Ntr-type)